MSKEAIEKLIRATRTAHEVARVLSSQKIDEIYGNLIDGIYLLINEKTDSLEESLTYQTIMNPNLTDADAAKILSAHA